MDISLKNNYLVSYKAVAIYLAMTVLIGISIILLSLGELECMFISNLQNVIHKTLGIDFFSAVTYLGDFYVWSAFSIGFLLYAYYKNSQQKFDVSIELIVYLILITVSTYLLKLAFARPRPDCININVYNQEAFFSYPSGHVSRATGALITLSGRRNAVKTALVIVAVLLLSISRIVLGVHFPTDILGGIFLSLAIQKATKVTICSFR